MTDTLNREEFFAELEAYLERIADEQGFVEPEQAEPDDLRPRALEAPLALSFPVETSRQSPNFYTPTQVRDRWGLTRKVTEITIHHWGSDGQHFDNVVSWLCNKDAQASSHYVAQGTDAAGKVNRRVARIVSETNAAWTNGSREGNSKAVTIECRPEATEEDYKVVAELIRDIRSRHGDVPIRPHYVWTSTECPGDWDLIKLDRMARAGRVWSCTKYVWRGHVQCSHSVPKLDLLAKNTPNDILVWLIQGAFTTSTDASAGTHAGGGAGDQKGSGYSWTLMGVCETVARKFMLLYWRRRYIRNLWSQHGHFLDPECPRLSKAAQAQFYLFEKGYDGLVGNNADTGYRGTADEIMRLFRNRLNADPVPEPGEDDMPTLSDFWNYKIRLSESVANAMGKAQGTRWSAQGLLMYGAAAFFDIRKHVRPNIAVLRGEVAGLVELVKALGNSQGTPVDEIIAAIQSAAYEGAKQGAIEQIDTEISDAEVILNPSRELDLVPDLDETA